MTGERSSAHVTYGTFALWRLVAACLIATYHFCHYAPDAAAVTAWFERMSPMLDMFFIVSGFLIYERYHGRLGTPSAYGLFLLRRFARIYPLHLVTLACFIPVGIAVHAGLVPSVSGEARYDFSTLPANLLLVQAWGVIDKLTFNFVSWSLSAEWFAYLFVPVLCLAWRRGGMAALVGLLVAQLAALEYVSWNAPNSEHQWWNATWWGAYRVLADFTFGVLLFRVVERAGPRWTPAPWIAWAVMGFAMVAMQLGAGPYLSIGMIGVAIVIGALADRAQAAAPGLSPRLMALTNLSYGIYLWHPVVQTIVFSGLMNFVLGVGASAVFYPLLGLAFALTFAVAAASQRLIEIPAANAILALGPRSWSRRPADPAGGVGKPASKGANPGVVAGPSRTS